LIVSTQRFGFPGGGAGKASRHDVVFVERNGLRHGEFGVRMPKGAVANGDGDGERKWGYRVREVLCSAGMDVVALWLEAEEGDIGISFVLFWGFMDVESLTVQLWTTGNYHWSA
jgi:elongator complex protein 1